MEHYFKIHELDDLEKNQGGNHCLRTKRGGLVPMNTRLMTSSDLRGFEGKVVSGQHKKVRYSLGCYEFSKKKHMKNISRNSRCFRRLYQIQLKTCWSKCS